MENSLAVCSGLFLILEFLTAVEIQSLRDFSRSRLDEICRERQNEARFGLILKQYERALLASEFLHVVVLVAFVVCLVSWWGLWQLPGDTIPNWLEFVGSWLLLLAVLFGSSVVLPWTAARVSGEIFLYYTWPVVRCLLTVSKPLVSLAYEVDKVMHRLKGLEEPTESDAATLTEEIRTVVDEGQRGGILESEARTMIHRVMELQKEDVAAVMTPRTEMVCIGSDATLNEARELLIDAGHSRVPVIGESPDDIIGVLYAKDLLKYFHTNGEPDKLQLNKIVREPFYVPETSGIDNLLETMKQQRVHVAIVLDEYGGVAGLVTMEDVLEEIVGEIVDEYDPAEEEPIRQVSPGVTEVEARVHIDDLNERFQYELPEDSDFDTIGGFVCAQLGRVPETGETIPWKQLRITVLEADKRRILTLRIEVDRSPAAALADD